MIYLLDVNVLLALTYDDHRFHMRTTNWLIGVKASDPAFELATCSIIELGFVRVACGAARFTGNVDSARMNLSRLRKQWPFVFFGDGLDANQLPAWTTRSKQVTDGHLLQLARHYEATFATLDEGIPGSLLIPDVAADPSGVRERRLPYGVAA